MSLILSGTAGLSDVDGSAATPAIRGTDTNTGIFFPAADTIAFAEGGVEAMRLDSSGNMGLGVTPSAQLASYKSFQFGIGGNLIGRSDNAGIELSSNAYRNSVGTYIYLNTDNAASYRQYSGQHQWFNAPSGTAGNAISFTQAMTLDASGNLGVGTTSPAQKVEANTNANSQQWLSLRNLNSGSGSSMGVLLGNDANSAFGSIFCGSSSYSSFGGASSINLGTYSTTPLVLFTNNTERARIDSSGRAGFGYSSPNANFVIGGAGGSGWITGARNTLQLRNVNSSSNQSNYIAFGSAGTDVSCSILNDINANGTTVNQLNIQAGTSGGVYLANGGTSWTAVSDERYKDIIEPITDAASKVSALRAVIGKYKVDADGIRRSFLIAQDVKAVLPEAVTNGEDPQGNEQLGLSYSDVIPLLVAAIKEQQNIITQLQADVAALKAKA